MGNHSSICRAKAVEETERGEKKKLQSSTDSVKELAAVGILEEHEAEAAVLLHTTAEQAHGILVPAQHLHD